ncbi:hypothetical protein N7448_000380 [Penicillium atrosanguineum]|nr:hypothetical protein N7448_000380 [Penicillium atrosanguineum]
MADHTLDIPELLQSASIKRHPDPAHDINPSTAASEKQPVVAAPVSDAASIASDIVDPSRVLLPLIQGTVWTLALSGWRFWNRNASLSGHTLGSRIRRWWYDVNNWKVPPLGWTKDPKVAAQVEDFYGAEFSNTGAD